MTMNQKNRNLEVFSSQEIESGKTWAIVSYITVLGLMVAMVKNRDLKNRFVTFHIRQTFGLCVMGMLLLLFAFLPIIGWLLFSLGYILLLVMWLIGLLAVLDGKAKPTIVLGEKFQKWFNEIV